MSGISQAPDVNNQSSGMQKLVVGVKNVTTKTAKIALSCLTLVTEAFQFVIASVSRFFVFVIGKTFFVITIAALVSTVTVSAVAGRLVRLAEKCLHFLVGLPLRGALSMKKGIEYMGGAQNHKS